MFVKGERWGEGCLLRGRGREMFVKGEGERDVC